VSSSTEFAPGGTALPPARARAPDAAGARSRSAIAPLALLALLGTGCPPVVLPTPQCPAGPPAPPPAGPPTSRAGRKSLEIDLRSTYVRTLLGRTIATAAQPSPTATSGADVVGTSLVERTAGGQREDLVEVRFAVWLRGGDGGHVMLPERTYTLQLRLVPHLVTPATVPDPASRRALLQCGAGDACQNGVVVALELLALTGGGVRGPEEPVDCRTSRYDLIDEQVLGQAYAVVGQQAPIALRVDGVLDVLSALTAQPAHLVGLDWAADGDLQVALVVDQGTPATFAPGAPELLRFSNADWGASVDTALLAPLITSKVADLVREKATQVKLDPPSVAFTADGLQVDVAGKVSVPVCGDVPFTASILGATQVCDGALWGCAPPIAPQVHPASGAQSACVAVGTALVSAVTAIGSALSSAAAWVASLGSGAGPRPAPAGAPGTTCFDAKDGLVLPLGNLDLLRAGGLSTDREFYLYGRSGVMDALNPARPILPGAPCPK
jgi:hypothetical protein